MTHTKTVANGKIHKHQ